MEVIPEEIPLIIVSKKFVEEEAVLLLIIEAELVTPFTEEVKVLVLEVKLLVVVGKRPIIEVVATTPFKVEVIIPPA